LGENGGQRLKRGGPKKIGRGPVVWGWDGSKFVKAPKCGRAKEFSGRSGTPRGGGKRIKNRNALFVVGTAQSIGGERKKKEISGGNGTKGRRTPAGRNGGTGKFLFRLPAEKVGKSHRPEKRIPSRGGVETGS